MKFLTDWRRPEDRDEILWIEIESMHEYNPIKPLETDSRETWTTANIDDPPDRGWSISDSAEHTSDMPRYSTDLTSEDPEDVVWIDDDSHDESTSGLFSTKPSTSRPFIASSAPEETSDWEEESEGILQNKIGEHFYPFLSNIFREFGIW